MKIVSAVVAALIVLSAGFDVARAADPLEVVAKDALPADVVKVDIAKMKYAPATLEVEAGTTVEWTNSDAVPHNVQIGTPAKIMGAMLRTGQTMAIRFNEAGDYSYTCTPHPFMKGGVKVKPKA
ncbi:amicyanin [Hyphomicrobium nitrativorans NL23]|uniref:Amicyanin n=1 Tax=Hyphomicrobium nitrativorans NL23 TaxID=1029756 RepID=V5SC47_9HYPH|nr:plastocyanin/azurin family copper-binding protein [Hyphomicrobium nitrativorans]AHB47544.1 amicyanin [Hyphomicrobium nitrativorans NL23]